MKSLLIALPLLLGRSVEAATAHYDQLAVSAKWVGNRSTSECYSVRIAVDSVLSDSTSYPVKGRSPVELVIRVGNESNQVDGVLGPFTYGLEGHFTFANGTGIEAAMIRLHEPGSPAFNSFLDEGQISLKLPETVFLQQHLAIAATLWSNRMIDMYTSVGGIEASEDLVALSVSLGLYAGAAVRNDVTGRFLGARLGVSHTFGSVEVGLEQMAGVLRTPGDPSSIGGGAYQKTSLEASTEVNLSNSLPLTLTFSVEKRYFDFGNGGPVNDPLDAYILVLGVEINITGILSSRN